MNKEKILELAARICECKAKRAVIVKKIEVLRLQTKALDDEWQEISTLEQQLGFRLNSAISPD